MKALLGYGARMPKELMLFVKNLVPPAHRDSLLTSTSLPKSLMSPRTSQ